MGHIRKQGKNSWQVIVSKGKNPVTGKYEQIYETVRGTKTKAKERMHELEHKVANGTYVEPSKMTFAELCGKWFQDYAKTNLAESTQEYYDIIINTHLSPILGKMKIADLQPMHIQDYIRKKLTDGRKDNKEGGLSQKSVRRHYKVINQVLKYAVKLQVLENNPAKHVDPPAPNDPEIKALTQEQLEKILDAAEGWLHDFIYIAAMTGVRRGELLGLRWQDVDLEGETIQIRQTAIKLKGGRLEFTKPKTNSSVRLITIDDDVISILKKRRKAQKENKLKLAGEYNNEHNLVFTKANGEPFNPRYVTRSFKKIAREVGLGQFRLHDLRHTHATLMLKAGVHPKVVQERLGHSSIRQTLDTYSHITPNMQREAVEKLKNSMEK